jgi:hypothetical protein
MFKSKAKQVKPRVLKSEPIPFDVECQISYRDILGVGVCTKRVTKGKFRRVQNSSMFVFETEENKLLRVDLPSLGTYANEILEIVILETNEKWNFYK